LSGVYGKRFQRYPETSRKRGGLQSIDVPRGWLVRYSGGTVDKAFQMAPMNALVLPMSAGGTFLGNLPQDGEEALA